MTSEQQTLAEQFRTKVTTYLGKDAFRCDTCANRTEWTGTCTSGEHKGKDTPNNFGCPNWSKKL